MCKVYDLIYKNLSIYIFLVKNLPITSFINEVVEVALLDHFPYYVRKSSSISFVTDSLKP
jgi:hypothetical protein